MLRISVEKNVVIQTILDIPSSKSISNRALIIQALCTEKNALENPSISDDTKVLKSALEQIKNKNSTQALTINIGLAGTAFRFLTAFLATQNGKFILTGAKRIQERPIKPLVEALQKLGADISYLNNEGFAPLLIKGKKLKAKTLEIDADISSQFITALLLISPSLNQDFVLKLNNKISSKPYIDMTLSLMKNFGINSSFIKNNITISKGNYVSNTLFIEADWSSASYFYECLALANEGEIILKNYSKKSIQGDSKLAELFIPFGVETMFKENMIRLVKKKLNISFFEYDFSNEPDLAQTFIALCCGLNIKGTFSGLETLKIKETNRISAMNNEIQKIGFELIETEKKGIYTLQKTGNKVEKEIVFKTYKDHRMAMSLAPLALKFENISIENHEVVSKSNPLFWEQMESLGFNLITKNTF